MEGDNGLVMEQYSRGFLVGGGSVRPKYGLFSVSNLRLYFCLPPRTRSRRTPGLQTTHRMCHEDSTFSPTLHFKGTSKTLRAVEIHNLEQKCRTMFNYTLTHSVWCAKAAVSAVCM